MSDTDRRTFLKSTALAAATLALSAQRPGHANAPTPTPPTPPTTGPDSEARKAAVSGVTWDKAPCRFCGTGCHVQVGTKDGRVVAIQGDQKAEVNKGLLCVKGYHVGLALYGKDRLTQPLLRKNGKMVPIGWDEAIETIAKRIMAAPERFAFYGSGQWTIPEGYAAQKLMKAGLSNNHIEPNARLCMASAVTGFLATYGVDEPAGVYDDFDVADVVICWGNNPAEMHPILFSRIVDRRARGEKVTLIDIGTRKTRTTEHAQHYLEFKPQGDLAIANGVMRLLLERDTWDKDFVGKHCAFRGETDPPTLQGQAIEFSAFKKGLEPFTPEYVQEVAGIDPKDLAMLADLFGDRTKKITSLWCMGMNQHTRGTAINNLVHALHLLSGHFGTPGNAPTSLTGQPSACGTAREVGTFAHGLPGGLRVDDPEGRKKAEKIWNLPEGRIHDKLGLHTVAMWESFCTPKADGGKLDTLWVQVTNPGQTMPNLNALFRKKEGQSEKFLIVSDVYPTATTALADLILPSAMWVEKNGMYGNSERRTQQWFRQVMPPGEARDDCWQTIAVSRKLFELGHPGMKDKDGRWLFETKDKDGREVPIWQWERYYDVNVDERLFEEYRQFSKFKHKDLAPYQEYVKSRGLRWPVIQQADGSWKETRWRFAEHGDVYVEKGKGFDFYHSTSKDGRAQIWSHPYTPPPEVPDAEYPFWLCTGRVVEHWHSGTMTMRIPPLRRAMPGAYVELNPADAKRLGIGQGERVLIESRRGKLVVNAWIDGRGVPPEGSVFVPFFDETKLINLVTLEAHDPFSKQPDYKKCAVRISRVGT